MNPLQQILYSAEFKAEPIGGERQDEDDRLRWFRAGLGGMDEHTVIAVVARHNGPALTTTTRNGMLHEAGSTKPEGQSAVALPMQALCNDERPLC